MSENFSKKVLKNTVYNIIGRFWSMGITLAMTPYIVGHLGLERFGVWALVSVVTGYFGLFDFGVGGAFVKYIAEFHAKREYGKINHTINAGFALYAVFTVCIVLVYHIFSAPILDFLKIPAGLREEANFVFMASIALFGISNAMGSFGAVQTGLQRMDISNILAISLSFPNIAGTVFVLERGYGLKGLIINNFFIFTLACISNVIIAKRIFPYLRFNPAAFDTGTFMKLMKFGFRMQIAKISGFVANQTDKIMVSYFLSLGMVSFFQLGNTIVEYAMSVSVLLISALIPAFSQMEALGRREKLEDSYLRSTKYLSFFVVPLFGFIFATAPNIMRFWMGEGYGQTVGIIRILSVAWLVNAIAQVGASAAIAIDKPKIMSTSAVITVTLNIALSLAFIKTFGFLGVAWGTAIAVNIGTAYFFFELHKHLKISIKPLVRILTPYLIISTFACLVVLGADLFVGRSAYVHDRTAAAGILLAYSLIFFGIYLAGIRFGRVFDSSDKAFLHKQLPFLNRLAR